MSDIQSLPVQVAAKALQKNGRNVEALAILQAAMEAGVVREDIMTQAAALARGLKQYDLALSYAAEGIKITPSDYGSHSMRVAVLTDLGRYDDARKAAAHYFAISDGSAKAVDLQRVVERRISEKDVRNVRGDITHQSPPAEIAAFIRKGNWAQVDLINRIVSSARKAAGFKLASDLLADWKKVEPDNPHLLHAQAVLIMRQGKYGPAASLLLQSIAEHGWTDINAQLAVTAARKNNDDALARNIIGRWSAAMPQSLHATIFGAEQHMADRDYPCSAAAFKRVLAREPQNGNAAFGYLKARMLHAGYDRAAIDDFMPEVRQLCPAGKPLDERLAYLAAKAHVIRNDYHAAHRYLLPAVRRAIGKKHMSYALAVLYFTVVADGADEGRVQILDFFGKEKGPSLQRQALRIRRDVSAMQFSDPSYMQAMAQGPGPKISVLYERPVNVPVNRAAGHAVSWPGKMD